MIDASLTPLELERIIGSLNRYRSTRRGPWEYRELNHLFGRSVRSTSSTLKQLRLLGLIESDESGAINLSRSGVEAMDAHASGDWGPLTSFVLRAGHFEEDITAFLREADIRDGQAVLNRLQARTVCPVLAAVIDWRPDWREGNVFVVPVDALEAVMIDVALEIAEARPIWVVEREHVGQRAEAYSLRRERELRGAAAILHVSRDVGDSLGYDLEDVSVRPSRLIECKGSRSNQIHFVLTARERDAANRYAERYEIQYWGEIVLDLPPENEYLKLLQAGYPRIISDPMAHLGRGDLREECTAWLITNSLRQFSARLSRISPSAILASESMRYARKRPRTKAPLFGLIVAEVGCFYLWTGLTTRTSSLPIEATGLDASRSVTASW